MPKNRILYFMKYKIDENKIIFKNLEDFSEEELLEVDNYI